MGMSSLQRGFPAANSLKWPLELFLGSAMDKPSEVGAAVSGEKRQYPRYPISGAGRFELVTRDMTLQGALLDVSVAGVGLIVPYQRPALPKVVADVGTLSMEAEDLPQSVRCEVSWIEHHKFLLLLLLSVQ